MNSCLACNRVYGCQEFIETVIEVNPRLAMTYSCKRFRGISGKELEMRQLAVRQFGNIGIRALAEKETESMAYSDEELKGMERLDIRNLAAKCGLSLAESKDLGSAEIRKSILDNQKGGEPAPVPTKEGPAPVAAVEVAPQTAPTPQAPMTIDQKIDVIGNMVSKEFALIREWMRVEDRKLNMLLGAATDIGKGVVGPDFDPGDLELCHGDKDNNSADLNMIEASGNDEETPEDH